VPEGGIVIYRIAIYRDGKFDHYATDEELRYLRVSADGLVEGLCCNVNDNNCITAYVWKPLGEYTHKVEWGFEIDGKQYYENDIVRIRTIHNDWDRTDCVVESENYYFSTDSTIEECVRVVRMFRGVLTTTSDSDDIWDNISQAVSVFSANMTKETFIEQLPNNRWDEEIVQYLIDGARCRDLNELLEYMNMRVIGNIQQNPELLEEK
jgi:hypothetical protein